jgi:hypothetical protein
MWQCRRYFHSPQSNIHQLFYFILCSLKQLILGGDMYGYSNQSGIPGSGGGNAGSLLGGAGGGLVHVSVYGYFYFSGTLSANGNPGANGLPPAADVIAASRNGTTPRSGDVAAAAGQYSGAGGGSGGSIYIRAGSVNVLSSAKVSARGGNGGKASYESGLDGGGGAGGRVFFWINATLGNGVEVVGANVAGGITPCKGYVQYGTVLTQCVPGMLRKKKEKKKLYSSKTKSPFVNIKEK